MILTSANTLENKEIVEYKGLVTGESLIGANIYKDLFPKIKWILFDPRPFMIKESKTIEIHQEFLPYLQRRQRSLPESSE